jgi:hypothetical protein
VSARAVEATGISRAQRPALVGGVVFLALSVVGWFLSPAEFYRAYLPSYIFWFEIVAGSLAILMIQYVTGGEWGLLIRRPLGAAARTMVVMLVLFIPIVIGMHAIYPWADHDLVAQDHVLHKKQVYLNPTAWIIRSAVYFGCWILWAWRLRILSLQFYEDRAPETELRRRKWAGLGLVMIVLTLTFASVDWLMSLEPKWYSSMYGINFTISCGLSGYAYVTFLLTQLSRTRAMQDILKPSHLRDLGNLMLAFVMLWAYTAFSQYLLIWYGNLKEEVPYYIVRQQGTWGWIAGALIIFHFFLPFFLLLMRPIKDRAETIAIVTIIILVARYIYDYWLIGPALYGNEFHFSWMSATVFIGIGGVWFWFLVEQLKGQTIIPIHETWVEEAIREGRFKASA